MLTGYQASTGAYYDTEEGSLYCTSHVDELLEEERPIKPLSNYGLDEEQTARTDGWDPEDIWGDEVDQHSDECQPALLCDSCGAELVEAYHYHPEQAEVEPLTDKKSEPDHDHNAAMRAGYSDEDRARAADPERRWL